MTFFKIYIETLKYDESALTGDMGGIIIICTYIKTSNCLEIANPAKGEAITSQVKGLVKA